MTFSIVNPVGAREIEAVGGDFNCGGAKRGTLDRFERRHYSGAINPEGGKKLSLNQEWAWAAGIVAIPAIIFGAFELMVWLRRRRLDAAARRSKGPRRQAATRIRPDRGA